MTIANALQQWEAEGGRSIVTDSHLVYRYETPAGTVVECSNCGILTDGTTLGRAIIMMQTHSTLTRR